ncbi:cytochrome P450 1A1-like isoform X1 [Watersipora subatra]|uniref:cytochrome P450 1A1-like isoform X1 n=1 Tax=Watersipora subatra TaxID=2589382 RepID=UPI00355B5403
MQDTIQEMTEEINRRGDQVINTADLCSGYVGCVIASMMFGEKYSFDDEVCQMLHKMNKQLIAAADPFTAGVLFDFFPFLLKFKFLFPKTQQTLEDANQVFNDFVKTKTEQFRDSYDPNDKRGCLDYFIEIQQKELDKDGKPLLDNEGVKGLLLDFLNGGLETSQNGLRQMFLDLVTDPTLQRDLQAEIDSQFEPTHKITLKDREMLPQLESYMLESLRYLSQTPFLIPHMTIRDTGVAGYKIPANTIVLMNSFYLAHNPDVYEKPFTLEPKRFLDEDGNLLKSDHPLKENFIGFGAGRRQCPGELFAKSRIFLLLSNILQKYNVELAGELPDHDVRKYPMSILLVPPSVKVHLIQRQQ